MAKGGTVACLLPATSFYLGAGFAPARSMVEAGVPVAMASDFNPGSCPCLNMQFVIGLGCLKYKLTPEEVLTAVTLNGAAAIGMADQIGSVGRTGFGLHLLPHWKQFGQKSYQKRPNGTVEL